MWFSCSGLKLYLLCVQAENDLYLVMILIEMYLVLCLEADIHMVFVPGLKITYFGLGMD